MSDLQPIEFYEAEFKKRYFSIKVKTKLHRPVEVKVYIGAHQSYFGMGNTYQEALAKVYQQLLKIDKQRAKLGSVHPTWDNRE
jgi:flagellin-like hook-associated protein FlgL